MFEKETRCNHRQRVGPRELFSFLRSSLVGQSDAVNSSVIPFRLTSRTHSWAGRETDNTRLSNSYVWAFTASAIFLAWEVPLSSCRTPKQATHTRGSVTSPASPSASLAAGSSFARLLGGSSQGSDASWDLFSASWDVVSSASLMKSWSSLSVSCRRVGCWSWMSHFLTR